MSCNFSASSRTSGIEKSSILLILLALPGDLFIALTRFELIPYRTGSYFLPSDITEYYDLDGDNCSDIKF